MVDITNKVNSLRKAIAQAVVSVSSPDTIRAIEQRQVPKGDVFEFSRAAGLLAVKKTSDVIPDCHPLPVEYTAIKHHIEDLNIIITVEVHTIYRTGVEVEAMHGAAITALTMYDMLKPIDKQVEIGNIKLLLKKGGKSQYAKQTINNLQCAVIVCSDTVSAGKQEDLSGKAIIKKLEGYGLATSAYRVIPDEVARIQETARELCAAGYNLALFTGGTGLSKRDVTPEALTLLINRQIPGIMEAARNYGQERTPYAMLSRGVSGFIDEMLVLTLPGSTSGATETMDALFPYLLHVFQVAAGMRHTSS